MQALRNYIVKSGVKDIDTLRACVKKDFNINCRVDIDERGEHLYTFKYDHINSTKDDPVVMECRGLVLDSDMNLVFKGFDRFFNVGENVTYNLNFNWDSFETYEKADGSLIKLYYYNGYWQIGTSGTAIGGALVPNTWGEDTASFREAVIDCLGYEGEEDFQNNAHKAFFNDLNYVFEFISPRNRIVTPYEKEELVLLSVFQDGVELHRDVVNEELDDMHQECLNVRAVKCYNFTKEELFQAINNLEGLQEGFVVRDDKGLRMKIKSGNYVLHHSVRGDTGLTIKKACSLVLSGEDSEYLAYFPDDVEKIEAVKNVMVGYFYAVDTEYSLYEKVENAKDFAEVVGYGSSSVKHLLFKMRKNNIDAQQAFHSLLDSKKLNTLIELMKEEVQHESDINSWYSSIRENYKI